MKIKEDETKNKKSILFYIEVLLIILIIIATIMAGYAWARYSTIKNSEAEAEVAKWHFDLKDGNNNSINETNPIDFGITSNNYVAENRIAPGTSGEFEIIVDTEGTETDVAYDVNIALTNCPRNMVFNRVTTEARGRVNRRIIVEEFFKNKKYSNIQLLKAFRGIPSSCR